MQKGRLKYLSAAHSLNAPCTWASAFLLVGVLSTTPSRMRAATTSFDNMNVSLPMVRRKYPAVLPPRRDYRLSRLERALRPEPLGPFRHSERDQLEDPLCLADHDHRCRDGAHPSPAEPGGFASLMDSPIAALIASSCRHTMHCIGRGALVSAGGTHIFNSTLSTHSVGSILVDSLRPFS